MYFETLRRIDFANRWIQESFNRLLELYEFLSAQIRQADQLFGPLQTNINAPGVRARVSYHAERSYVHVASAFPLSNNYRAVLAGGS